MPFFYPFFNSCAWPCFKRSRRRLLASDSMQSLEEMLMPWRQTPARREVVLELRSVLGANLRRLCCGFWTGRETIRNQGSRVKTMKQTCHDSISAASKPIVQCCTKSIYFGTCIYQNDYLQDLHNDIVDSNVCIAPNSNFHLQNVGEGTWFSHMLAEFSLKSIVFRRYVHIMFSELPGNGRRSMIFLKQNGHRVARRSMNFPGKKPNLAQI